MNTQRFIIGTVTGFIGMMAAGFLMYDIIFADMLASASPEYAAIMKNPVDMTGIAVGNLAFAALLAYIFEKWANIRNWMTGMTNGALIAFLVALCYDSLMQGTSTIMSWKGVWTDVLVFTLVGAVTGLFVALGLSIKRV